MPVEKSAGAVFLEEKIIKFIICFYIIFGFLILIDIKK
jgi:hypothetical protein